MSSNLNMNNLSLDAEVKPSGTFDTQGTTPTDALRSSPTSSTDARLGSPTSSSVVLRTSNDKLSRVTSYKQANISPGSLKPLSEAKALMEEDKILEEPWAKDEITQRAVLCILFLYGKGFYADKNRDERVTRIKSCVYDRKALDRLCRIAFSEASDRVLVDKKCFQLYANFYDTTRILFEQENFDGGFIGNVILRFQHSRNCYMTAASVWYALKLRFDGLGGEHVPDVAWIGRHKALTDDKSLEDRVVYNKGKSALKLAKKISQRTSDKAWQNPSGECLPRSFASLLLVHCNLFGPGLVCNFSIHPKFLATGKCENALNKPGYWRFDGDKDCEGQFVELDEDQRSKEDRAVLREKWEGEVAKIQDLQGRNKSKMNDLFSEWADCDAGGAEIKNDIEGPSSGKHAMVLLGGKKTGDSTYDLVLLNWWKGSPLIVVSPAYLQACGASVFFLGRPLSEETLSDIPTNPSLVSETGFPDEGDTEPDELPLPQQFDDDL